MMPKVPMFFRLFNFHLLLLFLVLLFLVDAFVSRRAKCSIECFTNCANSGTPLAVYCNCQLLQPTENAKCNSVTEQLLTDKTVERLIESDSGYKDSRTIWLRVAPVPEAFIYIFEFSIQQSFDRPIWTFAGASSSPQITFAVPDACRDYQFRTIVVLRSSNVNQQLTVFRPKLIPPQFPAFIVPEESIQLALTKQSDDQRTVHLSVSWQNPSGYDDADVYGYSPPTAYPKRCQTVDDHLDSPRLELVQGGAKMHLALPADVLRGQCHIYMEVRVLPRCVRIDPFDVKISVDLNCQMFPHLSFCQKENGPKCANVVDLWGRDDGRVVVAWQRVRHRADTEPSFYIVNWGTAEGTAVGHRPLAHPQNVSALSVAHGVQLKVPGNQTNLELSGVRPDIPYAVQICAFFSAAPLPREANPFRTEPIIPFICTICEHKTAERAANLSKECIDCSKIEQEKVPANENGEDGPSFRQKVPILAPFSNVPSSSSNVPSSSSNVPSSSSNVPSSSSNVPSSSSNVPSSSSNVPSSSTLSNVPSSSSNVPSSSTLSNVPFSSPAFLPSFSFSSLAPHHSVHFISSDTAVLEVIRTNSLLNATNTDEKGRNWQIKRQNHSKTHKTEMPLDLRKVEKQANSLADELTTMELTKKMVGKEDKTEGRRTTTNEETTTVKKSEVGETMEEKQREEKEVGRGKEEGQRRGEERKEEERGERGKETKTEEEAEKKKDEQKGTWEESAKSEGKEQREETIVDREEKRTKPTMEMPTEEKPTEKEEKRREGQAKQNTNESTDNQQTVIRNGQGEQSDQNKAERKPGTLTSSAKRRWLFAAPALFLLGLFVGLALLLLLVIRRRNSRIRPNAFLDSNSLPNSRKCMPKMSFPTGRSVLAARTMANDRFAAGNGTVGYFAGRMPPGVCSSPSSPASSPPFSATSSVSTVESRLGPSAGSASIHHEKQTERTLPSVTVERGKPIAPFSVNYFADNTVRFFMHNPSANGGGGNAFFGPTKSNGIFHCQAAKSKGKITKTYFNFQHFNPPAADQ